MENKKGEKNDINEKDNNPVNNSTAKFMDEATSEIICNNNGGDQRESNDWALVASVLDAVFFVLFLSVSLAMLLYIFLQAPTFDDSMLENIEDFFI